MEWEQKQNGGKNSNKSSLRCWKMVKKWRDLPWQMVKVANKIGQNRVNIVNKPKHRRAYALSTQHNTRNIGENEFSPPKINDFYWLFGLLFDTVIVFAKLIYCSYLLVRMLCLQPSYSFSTPKLDFIPSDHQTMVGKEFETLCTRMTWIRFEFISDNLCTVSLVSIAQCTK